MTQAPPKNPAAEFADAERRHQRALAAWQAEEETKQKQREEAERQAKAKQKISKEREIDDKKFNINNYKSVVKGLQVELGSGLITRR
ncbi:hypothetical protein [Magnetospira sp. QH-2]|uniref:hypothetical protein n=1 Tax=Magnetospira sp. (strain QH-2) TaxID=1288970 RepID=UPI0003E81C36|nr:hypothetical protein [Magnetospira sp. QH-2]CCQ72009.1 protein of unknown function [Magnetospira sp. QH-2]